MLKFLPEQARIIIWGVQQHGESTMEESEHFVNLLENCMVYIVLNVIILGFHIFNTFFGLGFTWNIYNLEKKIVNKTI